MSKPYVIGIDIGGTNTVFGIVDARGVVIASASIKTRKHNDIHNYIDELYQETANACYHIKKNGIFPCLYEILINFVGDNDICRFFSSLNLLYLAEHLT